VTWEGRNGGEVMSEVIEGACGKKVTVDIEKTGPSYVSGVIKCGDRLLMSWWKPDDLKAEVERFCRTCEYAPAPQGR